MVVSHTKHTLSDGGTAEREKGRVLERRYSCQVSPGEATALSLEGCEPARQTSQLCTPLTLTAQSRVQLSEQTRVTRRTPCFKRAGQSNCDTNSVRRGTQRCSPSCCIYWRRGVRSVAMMFESEQQALSAARTPALTVYFWRGKEHTLTLLRKATMR